MALWVARSGIINTRRQTNKAITIGRHAAEQSLICETVAKQAGTASLYRLVVDINPEAFANGINNVLWYCTRRDVEEFQDNAL